MATDMKVHATEYPRIIATETMVDEHKLTLSRSQAEIAARVGDESDVFGFTAGVLIDYLTYESARPLLTAEAVAKHDAGETWTTITSPIEAYQDFLDYMQFAWTKAMDERGLSAGRSIQKLAAWMWLLGRDDLEATLNDDDRYVPYGMPALIATCEALGIDVPDEAREFAERDDFDW